MTWASRRAWAAAVRLWDLGPGLRSVRLSPAIAGLGVNDLAQASRHAPPGLAQPQALQCAARVVPSDAARADSPAAPRACNSPRSRWLGVQVVLPEGSSDIEAFAPLPGVQQSRDTKFTYLDVFGRPVLVLRASNVVALTDDVLLVNYRRALAQVLPQELRSSATMGHSGQPCVHCTACSGASMPHLCAPALAWLEACLYVLTTPCCISNQASGQSRRDRAAAPASCASACCKSQLLAPEPAAAPGSSRGPTRWRLSLLLRQVCAPEPAAGAGPGHSGLWGGHCRPDLLLKAGSQSGRDLWQVWSRQRRPQWQQRRRQQHGPARPGRCQPQGAVQPAVQHAGRCESPSRKRGLGSRGGQHQAGALPAPRSSTVSCAASWQVRGPLPAALASLAPVTEKSLSTCAPALASREPAADRTCKLAGAADGAVSRCAADRDRALEGLERGGEASAAKAQLDRSVSQVHPALHVSHCSLWRRPSVCQHAILHLAQNSAELPAKAVQAPMQAAARAA